MTDKKAEEAVLDNHCGEISFSRLSLSFLSYFRRAEARALAVLSLHES